MNRKIWMLLCLATALLTSALTSCSTPHNNPAPLRIGSNVWPGYEPLYLARAKGYYDNTPVQLVEFSSPTEVVRAYQDGTIEAAALTMDEILLLIQKGLDPQIVLVMDFSNGADVVMGQAGYRSLKELKGKRIGVEGSALGAYTLSRALTLNHMKPTDIEIVQVPLNEHEIAFKSGLVDAVVTFEPIKTKLTQLGATLLFSSAEIPGEIVDVLVVQKKYLKSHPEIVKQLIDHWFLTLDYMKSNPRDAADTIVLRLGITPEQFTRSLKDLEIPNRNENQRLLAGPHPTLLTSAKHLEEIMLKYRLIERPVVTRQLLAPGSL